MRGYTLIEILVVLTIVGVLFGVGYANFRAFSQRQVAQNAAKTIQGDIRLAQGKALAGEKPDDVNCNSPVNSLNGYNFKVVSATEYKIEANCTGATPVLVKDVELPLGITISTPTPNPIIYKILGNGTNIPSGSSALITITQTGSGNTSVITLTSGGQIQ